MSVASMSAASVSFASASSRPSRLVCPGHLLPIVIQPQSTILIRGASGHGKSTLVKGITGALRGVCIDYEEAGTFRDSFVMVGQGIKHKLDFESLTLGELFQTRDTSVVERYLGACLLLPWYESSCQSSLDANIQVSGGERNRLTLAYHLSLVKQRNAPVLILDECEQGTDLYDPLRRHDCYELVRRIRLLCHDKTLLIVSHMYDGSGRPLVPVEPIEWTHIMTLESMQMTID